jgi:hypothetical protein
LQTNCQNESSVVVGSKNLDELPVGLHCSPYNVFGGQRPSKNVEVLQVEVQRTTPRKKNVHPLSKSLSFDATFQASKLNHILMLSVCDNKSAGCPHPAIIPISRAFSLEIPGCSPAIFQFTSTSLKFSVDGR